MTSIAFLSSVNSFVMLLLFVWFSSALTCIVCIAWISSDYFESLLLPLRGENDWKQSDEIQAIVCSVIQRCSSHDYWIILCIAPVHSPLKLHFSICTSVFQVCYFEVLLAFMFIFETENSIKLSSRNTCQINHPIINLLFKEPVTSWILDATWKKKKKTQV